MYMKVIHTHKHILYGVPTFYHAIPFLHLAYLSYTHASHNYKYTLLLIISYKYHNQKLKLDGDILFKPKNNYLITHIQAA